MLTTLQWYIFREMGKTFLLAAIGLTAVFGMGGGVMNLVELEQVTPAQLLRVILLILPVAGCLTLPVAALYSATATYGRMGADNEFVACRSSGINIQRLFLPPLTLSLLIAGLTFYFTSFLIPGLVRDLSQIAGTDLRQFVLQRLESPKRLGFPGVPVKIYADRPAPSATDENAVVLEGVAFLKTEELDDEVLAAGVIPNYVQFGAAESINIEFIRTDDGGTIIQGELINATVFDNERPSGVDVGNQQFGPNPLPKELRLKAKWFDLKELLHARRHPTESPDVADAIDEARRRIMHDAFFKDLLQQFAEGREIRLLDESVDVTIRARQAELNDDADTLNLGQVDIVETRGEMRRAISAVQTNIDLGKSVDTSEPIVRIRVKGDVVVEENGVQRSPRSRYDLDPVPVPDEVLIAAAFDDESLLNQQYPLDLGQVAAKSRASAIHEAGKFVRRLTSELHSRLAFSASAFALVILGAALGVIYRGSHVLAAFGISFVPALVVIVLNIMGRQLAEKQGTVVVGLSVMWGGIILVGFIDVWVLARVIRR